MIDLCINRDSIGAMGELLIRGGGLQHILLVEMYNLRIHYQRQRNSFCVRETFASPSDILPCTVWEPSEVFRGRRQLSQSKASPASRW